MTHDQLDLMATSLGNARTKLAGAEARDAFDLAVSVVAETIAVVSPRYDTAAFMVAAGAETERDRIARNAVRAARGVSP